MSESRKVPLVMMHGGEEKTIGAAVLHDDEGNVSIALEDETPHFLTVNGYGSIVHGDLRTDPERLFVMFEQVDP